MNRFIFLIICFIALTITCFAQDVIVTRNSRKINAKVLEVNMDNIKYKAFNNLEGPTYSLQKSDIITILYQNGKVETFERENVISQAETATPVQIQSTQTNATPSQALQSQRIQTTFQSQNQRTTQWKNPLSFLDGQERLDVVFNYEEFMIYGIPEKFYFEMRSQKEVDEWEKAKNTSIKAAFLLHLNQYLNARQMRMLC